MLVKAIPLLTFVMSLGVPTAAVPAPAAPPASSPSGAGIERFAIVPSASTVVYRVGETFFTQSRFKEAIGTTQAIQGDVYIDRAHPASSRIGTLTIDISTFRSDSARRDKAIRDRWLESARYPNAQFTPTAIRGLPAVYTDGQDIPIRVLGMLKAENQVRLELQFTAQRVV